jgi:hypothetical protein
MKLKTLYDWLNQTALVIQRVLMSTLDKSVIEQATLCRFWTGMGILMNPMFVNMLLDKITLIIKDM